MMKEFTFGEKSVKITAYSDRIIRVTCGAKDGESLFDRYNLLAKPEENCGADIENGVSAGELSVTYENGKITFKTNRVDRVVDFDSSAIAEIKAYFNDTL